MIGLLPWSLGLAAPLPGVGPRDLSSDGLSEAQRSGLAALVLDAGVDAARATPGELDALYRTACNGGWAPACGSADWRDADDPVAAMGAALQEACRAGDRLACIPVAWSLVLVDRIPSNDAPDPGQGVRWLVRSCDAGVARACAEIGALRVEGVGLPHDPDDGFVRLLGACDRGEANACTIAGGLAASEEPPTGTTVDQGLALIRRGCARGDGLGCQILADVQDQLDELDPVLLEHLSRACDLGMGTSCNRLGVAESRRTVGSDIDLATHRYDIGDLYLRACVLDDPYGCMNLGEVYKEGLGRPADRELASELFLLACDMGLGEGCSAMADHLQSGSLAGYAMSIDGLYQQACDQGDPDACAKLKDPKALRPRYRRSTARTHTLFLPSARPYLGIGLGMISSSTLPRLGPNQALTVHIEGLAQDLRDRNQTLLAVDWRMQPAPWGARIAMGTNVWGAVPDEGGSAAPTPADLVAAVVRIDGDRRLSQRIGIGLSVAGTSSLYGDVREQHGRVTAALTHDPAAPSPVHLRGARTSAAVYAGGTVGVADQSHVGLVLADQRSIARVEAATGRTALALVTDGVVATRIGGIAPWLEHVHQAHLSPTISNRPWLRGHPVAGFGGATAVRGALSLRWAFAEYHGLREHIGLVLSPFAEVGAAAGQRQPTWPLRDAWRTDAGLALLVDYNRRQQIRLEAIVVPSDAGIGAVAGLYLEGILAPWDRTGAP